MNRIISLSDSKKGFPGIEPASAHYFYNACMVCLHLSNHSSNVLMELMGDNNCTIQLQWDNYFNEQIERSFKDIDEATEFGAICITAMLVIEFTGYTIIERSKKTTGFDYYLGNPNNRPFEKSARLEISGIFKESENNNIRKRYMKKKSQTNQSDHMRLPAYISIIEFSKPKALLIKKLSSWI